MSRKIEPENVIRYCEQCGNRFIVRKRVKKYPDRCDKCRCVKVKKENKSSKRENPNNLKISASYLRVNGKLLNDVQKASEARLSYGKYMEKMNRERQK